MCKELAVQQLPDIFRALELGETLALARLAEGDPKECKQVLDAGAAGVIKMAPDWGYNERALLSVLEEISDTEQGLIWVDASGVVHWDSRDTRTLAGRRLARFLRLQNWEFM